MARYPSRPVTTVGVLFTMASRNFSSSSFIAFTSGTGGVATAIVLVSPPGVSTSNVNESMS